MSDNKVKFQIKEGQAVRGIKSKTTLLDKEYAEKLEAIGVGFIIVEPDPFENLLKEVNSNDKAEKVVLEADKPEKVELEAKEPNKAEVEIDNNKPKKKKGLFNKKDKK